MKKCSSLIIILFLFVSWSYGQDLDSEIGFKYVKADYLLKTQRFDEALKELNEIIRDNPSFNNTLFLRADLRFKTADYVNAKNDILKVIELKGISIESAALLGRCDYALKNNNAAELSLDAAIKMGSIDEKVLLEHADLMFNKGSNDKACESWQKAARNGSSTAAINLSKNCGKSTMPASGEISTVPTQTVPTDPPAVANENSNKVSENDSSTNVTNDVVNSEEESKPIFSFPVPEEDNTINEIIIDEDLTISIFGQGMGKRKILEKPSILILSEVDGEVAVEICVNENGRVETAEFIASKSTIDNKGLVSLAVRKSRDFWFDKSDFRKQCGYIIYKVKGS
ncbi:MAG TPA: hypothetical protein PKD85_10785 [Saprospiraceae bacterium]|nr:hypothetical protein [Saprospiraceae bacterium]